MPCGRSQLPARLPPGYDPWMAYEYRYHRYEKFAIWSGLTVSTALALRWPIVLAQFITIVLLYAFVRIGACTIHAFVQGVNEGDDPRFAKRPPDPP